MTLRPRRPAAAVPALVLAAHRGAVDAVPRDEIDRVDPAGVTPLIAAAAAGHAALVDRLLASGASPARAAADGTTALLAALARGHVEVVRRLLPLSAPSARIQPAGYGHDFGAVRLAASLGDAALVAELMAAGAAASPGELALLVVRRLERAGRRVVLAAAGRDPTRSERYDGGDSLPDRYAVDELPAAELLPGPLAGTLVPGDDGAVYVRGAGVCFVRDPAAIPAARAKPRGIPVAPPETGALDLHEELCAPGGGARRRGALTWAVVLGRVAAVAALEPRGGELDRALLLAARWDQPEVIDLLVARGARPGKPSRGETPLSAGARSADVVARLLAAGADPDGAPGCEPPVLEVARWGDLRALDALIAAGADLGARTVRAGAGWGPGGQTALHVAAAREQLDKVRRLVQAGAPLDARDEAGLTPLQTLRARGNPAASLVEALLATCRTA